MSSLILRTPATASASLGNYKDPVIPSAGMKFLFDLASPLGWPQQANPANGLNVVDYANNANGSILIRTGQAVSWAGNGFDFSGVTLDGEIIVAPAGNVLKSIYDAANDYFMVVFYAKLPAAADWNAATGLCPMFCATTQETGYQVEADLALIGQKTGNLVTFRRQTAINAQSELTIDATPHNGKITQIAFWRNASGVGARLCSAGGIGTASGSVGSNNTADFSLQVPRFGICETFNNLASNPSHITAAKYRLYRGWIEDLTASGRDPLTVLDADYARTIARAVYS